MPRFLLLALFVLPLAACDSTGPEEPLVDPSPANAAITVSLDEVRVPADCDDGDNPGDFQFRVSFLDEGNQPIGQTLEFPSGAYGTNAQPSDVLEIGSGRAFGLNQTASLTRPRQDGSGFTVVFSATEWDSATIRDGRMSDRTRQRLYVYRDGRFGGITGTQSISNSGSQDCSVVLDYTIAVQ